jgi:hypothetical protein
VTSNLCRAIRGPIVLITVGVLFAMDQAGSFGVRQSWPVLLVVLGVLKVGAGVTAAPPAPGGH